MPGVGRAPCAQPGSDGEGGEGSSKGRPLAGPDAPPPHRQTRRSGVAPVRWSPASQTHRRASAHTTLHPRSALTPSGPAEAPQRTDITEKLGWGRAGGFLGSLSPQGPRTNTLTLPSTPSVLTLRASPSTLTHLLRPFLGLLIQSLASPVLAPQEDPGPTALLPAQEAPQDRAPRPPQSPLATLRPKRTPGPGPWLPLTSNTHYRLNRVPQNSCAEVLTSSTSESTTVRENPISRVVPNPQSPHQGTHTRTEGRPHENTREDTRVCTPGREASTGSSPVGTLTWDLQPLGAGGNTFLLLNLPAPGHSVREALPTQACGSPSPLTVWASRSRRSLGPACLPLLCT